MNNRRFFHYLCKDHIFNSTQDVTIQLKKVRSAKLTGEIYVDKNVFKRIQRNFDKIAEKTASFEVQ